jgi:Spy/CpxP family protein refolding chaperone
MIGRTMSGRISALCVGLFLITSGLSAQDHEMPGNVSHWALDGGMMMGEGMSSQMLQRVGQGLGLVVTGGAGPTMLLSMQEALSLTDDQKTQLELIQAEYSKAAQLHMPGMLAAHDDLRAALEGDSPDIGAYERALQDGADRMVQAHVAMARAAVEAGNVLSDEQRAQLSSGMPMIFGMMTGQHGKSDSGSSGRHNE